MKNAGREKNFQDLLEDAIEPLSIKLDELESVLVAFECAAYFVKENPNYDKPDFILMFRSLRNLQAELNRELSRAQDVLLSEEAVPQQMTADESNSARGRQGHQKSLTVVL